MKNTQLSRKAKSGVNSVQGIRYFSGTRGPRQLRAITALLCRVNVSREDLDSIAGTSNSPDLVAALRRRGLELPCERVICTDRDGRESRPGRYSLSAVDRRLVLRWLATQPDRSAA